MARNSYKKREMGRARTCEAAADSGDSMPTSPYPCSECYNYTRQTRGVYSATISLCRFSSGWSRPLVCTLPCPGMACCFNASLQLYEYSLPTSGSCWSRGRLDRWLYFIFFKQKIRLI